MSRAAAEMGLTSVIKEMELTDSLGRQVEDPLADVPDDVPVTKPRVSYSQ